MRVDPEEPGVEPQLLIEGEAFQPVGQGIGAGYQAGLFALAFDIEHGVTLVDADPPGDNAQGFGDPETCLEEGEDEQPVSDWCRPWQAWAMASTSSGMR